MRSCSPAPLPARVRQLLGVGAETCEGGRAGGVLVREGPGSLPWPPSAALFVQFDHPSMNETP